MQGANVNVNVNNLCAPSNNLNPPSREFPILIILSPSVNGCCKVCQWLFGRQAICTALCLKVGLFVKRAVTMCMVNYMPTFPPTVKGAQQAVLRDDVCW